MRPQIGAEYAVSLEEQEKQAEAMKILEDVVEAIVAEEKDPKHFSSLSIQVRAAAAHGARRAAAACSWPAGAVAVAQRPAQASPRKPRAPCCWPARAHQRSLR